MSPSNGFHGRKELFLKFRKCMVVRSSRPLERRIKGRDLPSPLSNNTQRTCIVVAERTRVRQYPRSAGSGVYRHKSAPLLFRMVIPVAYRKETPLKLSAVKYIICWTNVCHSGCQVKEWTGNRTATRRPYRIVNEITRKFNIIRGPYLFNCTNAAVIILDLFAECIIIFAILPDRIIISRAYTIPQYFASLPRHAPLAILARCWKCSLERRFAFLPPLSRENRNARAIFRQTFLQHVIAPGETFLPRKAEHFRPQLAHMDELTLHSSRLLFTSKCDFAKDNGCYGNPFVFNGLCTVRRIRRICDSSVPIRKEMIWIKDIGAMLREIVSTQNIVEESRQIQKYFRILHIIWYFVSNLHEQKISMFLDNEKSFINIISYRNTYCIHKKEIHDLHLQSDSIIR